MFGLLSIQKLLFTVLAIAIVWYGFKWYARIQANKGTRDKERIRGRRGGGGVAGSGRSRAAEPARNTEEMIKCPVCDVYVAAGSAVSCGRGDCPYPG